MTYIDNTIGCLGEAINRNFEKWPIIGQYVWPNYFIGDTYEDEISYLKNWITDRVDWIDDNIMLAETVSEDFSGDDIFLYPNLARDKINLNFYLTFSGEIRIEIIDLLGRKVLMMKCCRKTRTISILVSIDISKLSSRYFVIQVFRGYNRLGRGNILISGRYYYVITM